MVALASDACVRERSEHWQVVVLRIKNRACPACSGPTTVLRLQHFWRCLDASCGALGDISHGHLFDEGKRYRGGEIVFEAPQTSMIRQINEATGMADVQDRMEAVYRATVPGYADYMDNYDALEEDADDEQDLIHAIDTRPPSRAAHSAPQSRKRVTSSAGTAAPRSHSPRRTARNAPPSLREATGSAGAAARRSNREWSRFGRRTPQNDLDASGRIGRNTL